MRSRSLSTTSSWRPHRYQHLRLITCTSTMYSEYFNMKHHKSGVLSHTWYLIITICAFPSKHHIFLFHPKCVNFCPVSNRMTMFWRWDIFSALNGQIPTLLSAAPSSSSVSSRRRPWLEMVPLLCTMSMFEFIPVLCSVYFKEISISMNMNIFEIIKKDIFIIVASLKLQCRHCVCVFNLYYTF